MGDSPNGIELKGVSKSLRSRSILEDVDLALPRGAIVVVEGDNGAGKTTLVRIVSTVVTPDTGTVLVNGFDSMEQTAGVRSSIGVSFANERSLYWRVTGYQNLELFGQIAGLTKRTSIERAHQICHELRIDEAANGRVSRMSTGQRQRLLVARALLSNPAVLLLDEPFRGLDEDGLTALVSVVKDRASKGTTILIVAPLIESILHAADEVYRIEDRRVIPHTLYSNGRHDSSET
jgi:ABC-2 type transport system ATP-binding protein